MRRSRTFGTAVRLAELGLGGTGLLGWEFGPSPGDTRLIRRLVTDGEPTLLVKGLVTPDDAMSRENCWGDCGGGRFIGDGPLDELLRASEIGEELDNALGVDWESMVRREAGAPSPVAILGGACMGQLERRAEKKISLVQQPAHRTTTPLVCPHELHRLCRCLLV